jgi:NDP-sugar pyrophosphorylase family protein
MKRQKVTLTIREDLLKRVDEIIDNTRIRNRSHAIEYLLNEALKPKVKKAYILAGGEGVRMRPFTHEIPKALLPVKGKPILEYQIDLLKNAEIREIFILVGHLGEKIKYHFGDGSRFGVKISYLEQKKKTIGTGYALYLAKNFFLKETFLVLYGDELIEINLKDFIDFHLSSGGIATLALSSIEKPSLTFYGVAKLRGKKIVEFLEKPQEEKGISQVLNAGVFCFEPKIFDYLLPKANLSLENDIFPRLAKEGKLCGYLFEGKWFDVGTPEIYARAIKEW